MAAPKPMTALLASLTIRRRFRCLLHFERHLYRSTFAKIGDSTKKSPHQSLIIERFSTRVYLGTPLSVSHPSISLTRSSPRQAA
jgi:hypothetical protein